MITRLIIAIYVIKRLRNTDANSTKSRSPPPPMTYIWPIIN